MSTWGKSDKYTIEWINPIRKRRIKVPVNPTLLMLNYPPTLEASTLPIKFFPYKNCTQFNSLPLELLHKIDMWHAGIVHHNKLKLVLVKLTQHHTVLCVSTSNKLKYAPFE